MLQLAVSACWVGRIPPLHCWTGVLLASTGTHGSRTGVLRQWPAEACRAAGQAALRVQEHHKTGEVCTDNVPSTGNQQLPVRTCTELIHQLAFEVRPRPCRIPDVT